MSSRFKKSLGFIKEMLEEHSCLTSVEDDFCRLFVESPSALGEKTNIDIGMINICRNLYASFISIYDIERILGKMDNEGICFKLSSELLSKCGSLCNTSSFAMIDLDYPNYSFSNKYTLSQDALEIAKTIHERVCLYCSAIDELNSSTPVELTKFDELENHLNIHYIRDTLNTLKLFLVLVLFMISPLYPEPTRRVAKKVFDILREVLYKKRIIKIIVDYDLHGANNRSHKTTRLKIYFSMGNTNRYCIRLDFPHEGQNRIHLNLNEPNRKTTGFPFDLSEAQDVIKLCGSKELFEELFYLKDDLYWFKCNYLQIVRKKNDNISNQLDSFWNNKAHISLFSSSEDDMEAVRSFTYSFSEAMLEYGFSEKIYGRTDSEDEEFYRYIVLLDYIFVFVIALKNQEENRIVFESLNGMKSDEDDVSELQKRVREWICKFIHDNFSNDKELNEAIILEEYGFECFLSEVVDCIIKRIDCNHS